MARQFNPLGRKNFNANALSRLFPQHLGNGLANHSLRPGINRRLPWFYLKSGFGDPTDACPTCNSNIIEFTPRSERHFGPDLCAMRDIRIISGVFDDSADCGSGTPLFTRMNRD
jgi:hypothetical protein